jgi:hypothetical protein
MFRLIRLVPASTVMVGLFFLTAPDANAQRRSRPTASTMDSRGNTYTTGWRVAIQDGSNCVADLVTVKYDKSGNRLWTDSFPKNSGFGPDEIRYAEGWGIADDREALLLDPVIKIHQSSCPSERLFLTAACIMPARRLR